MTASISKRLFAQGGVYGLVRVFSQGAVFLLLPLYSRLLGDEEFGIVSLMGAVGTFLGFIFIQGLHGSWIRLRFDESTPGGLHRFETTIVWYLMASTLLGVGFFMLTGEWFARFVTPQVPFHPYGVLTVIYAAATVFVTLAERKFQAEQRPGAFAIFTTVRTVLTVGTIVVFITVFPWKAMGKLRADALSALVMTVAALMCIRPGSLRLFSPPRLRRALGYGLPLVPHNLAGLANDMIDRVLVTGMIGLSANGVYSMGYRVGAVGLLVAIAMNQAYAPLFVGTLKRVEACRQRGDEPAARTELDALAQAALLSITLIACVSLGAAAVAREALLVLAPGFTESWTVVAIVAAATVTWSCYFPFSQSLAYDVRRVRLLAVITISGAVVNILANLVLIRWMGMVGAAWATLLSSMVLAMLALRLGQASVPIPYRWGRWLRMLVSCLGGLLAVGLIDVAVGNIALRLSLKLLAAGVSALYGVHAAGARWSDLRRLMARGSATAGVP